MGITIKTKTAQKSKKYVTINLREQETNNEESALKTTTKNRTVFPGDQTRGRKTNEKLVFNNSELLHI